MKTSVAYTQDNDYSSAPDPVEMKQRELEGVFHCPLWKATERTLLYKNLNDNVFHCIGGC